MDTDIIGYRQWNEDENAEYVFCKECAAKDPKISKENPITVEDKKKRTYFCDFCERRL